jgi:hypothetical protein
LLFPDDEIVAAESFLLKKAAELGFLNLIFLNFSRMFEADSVPEDSLLSSVGAEVACAVTSSGFFSTAVTTSVCLGVSMTGGVDGCSLVVFVVS